VSLGDLATVKVHIHDLRRVVECGLGVQCISPFTNWRTLLAAEWFATVMPDWLNCLTVFATLIDITVSDVVPGTAADVVFNPPSVTHGSYAGEQAPANCSYVISWRSDGIGRNTRGRNYLSGLPVDWTAQGHGWNGDAFAAIETLVSVILAQYGPTGFSDLARLQIISRGPHGAPLATPQAFPVTHAFFDQDMRSNRKRLQP